MRLHLENWTHPPQELLCSIWGVEGTGAFNVVSRISPCVRVEESNFIYTQFTCLFIDIFFSFTVFVKLNNVSGFQRKHVYLQHVLIHRHLKLDFIQELMAQVVRAAEPDFRNVERHKFESMFYPILLLTPFTVFCMG